MLYRKKGLYLFIFGFSGFCFFYVLPYFYSFYYAFIESSFNRDFVAFRNFINTLSNRYYQLALANTFEFTLIGVPMLMVISFALAILVRSNGIGHKALRSSAVIPVLLPSAAVVTVWDILFGGFGNFAGHTLLIQNAFLDQALQKFPIYMFFVWKNTGFNVILFLAGFSGIPEEIYESSEIDGAGKLQKHKYITFPLLIPTIFFVLIFSLVNSFRVFKETYLLYGSYPSEGLYFVQHFMNNHFNKLNYQYLSTGAIIFSLLVYVIAAAGYKLENRLSKGVW